MKRDEFGAWLGRKGITTVSFRRSLATRVERALTTLGYASNDLDEAFATDGLTRALERLAELGRTLSVGEPLPILLPDGSRNPSARLASMAGAIRKYRDFAAGKPAVPEAEDADREAVWLVTARDGDKDGLAGFIERGEWSLLHEGRYSDKVREMRPGDRIVMRDYTSRSIDPPFETNGANVSSMLIRATGTISENRDDGLSVAVDWDEPVEPRTWYFYTSNNTVWRLPDTEYAARLISFLFDGEPQEDYNWWLTQPGWRDRFSPVNSDADRIRRHALEEYIEPARERGDASVTVGVRAVNDALGLKDGWPNICQALAGHKFLEMASLAPPERIGKPMSSATSFRFMLGEAPAVWSPEPTNLILYGPPGTGKTYATAREAVRLCTGVEIDDRDPEGRAALMAEYERLVGTGQIAFVTFHQSYAYEDFIEGLRPPSGAEPGEEPGFRLDVRAGRFREIATLAEQARKLAIEGRHEGGADLSGRRFWKMGLGAIGTEDDVYQACIDGNFIALGWGGDLDWTDSRFTSLDAMRDEWQVHFPADQFPDRQQPSQTGQTWTFRNTLRTGDIVIIPYGNSAFRAVGEVTGDYYFERSDLGSYSQRRPVRWMLKLDEPLPLDRIVDGKFTMRTLYQIDDERVRHAALERLVGGSEDSPASHTPDQFVLVIDEINRANISKVFGELITLIEPDKRLGKANALTVKLPYSPGDFGVPANLHIIGTMNTADRSIALLDTALRRRFDFQELMPEPEKLAEAARRSGIDLVALLAGINNRVEYLYDREHQIGHAFFMGCATPADVEHVLRRKVIPLLQEYFYEDWEKVAQALGDGEAVKAGRGRFLSYTLLAPPPGVEERNERWRWTIRDRFDLPRLPK